MCQHQMTQRYGSFIFVYTPEQAQKPVQQYSSVARVDHYAYVQKIGHQYHFLLLQRDSLAGGQGGYVVAKNLLSEAIQRDFYE